VPDPWSSFALGKLNGPIEVKGIAYGGNRGISSVELSSDGGKSWREAEIYYSRRQSGVVALENRMDARCGS
jgi:hypothetical protein